MATARDHQGVLKTFDVLLQLLDARETFVGFALRSDEVVPHVLQVSLQRINTNVEVLVLAAVTLSLPLRFHELAA